MPPEKQERIKRILNEMAKLGIQLSPGQYNFYMTSSEFPNGVVLFKQKDRM